ncbi:VWA domain-containing protein [Streptomyces sp. AK02-01A]|uniref:substrate-binding and vWA domain-containing protein n=1 Tax=Streptomyces sp. AK02-01A TaxID=3028648 RepID=UPI0029BCC3A6|nr:VWA domain-containing protein [Streptomyces sp. AK02-01A]MDX3851699.1 VWA domain-containing protein [Streptomyces sp. AK02-01A]
MRRPLGRPRLAAVLIAALLTATACSPGDGPDQDKGGADTTYRKGTLRVLASSELADMRGVLDQAEQRTGVTVRATWTGTLDAAELIASGGADGKYDAVWLSSNDYLRLHPGAAKRLTNETPVMSSPVALGVKASAVDRLGWQPDQVTWSQVHQAVAAGKLTYGMTDPVRSNSGFSALISVASGLSGAQSALTDADVRRAAPKLKEFFTGQKLTSGSSGWLATAYTRRGSVDALVNYESVLLSMNRDSDTGLTVIRPKDGVVTADYPFTLLTSAPREAREAGQALTAYLRGPEAQRALTEQTFRRPVVPSVRPAAGLATDKRRELPFPGTRSVADGLLDSYENQLRRPSRTVYVLDTSGSMKGERLSRLKTALAGLTGTDDSPTGDRFRDREEVTLMPFGSEVKRIRTHTVDPADPAAALDAIRADAKSLTASGDTAIYSSLRDAYAHLGAGGRDAFTSIVLMTDGENTTGASAGAFDSFYAALPPAQRATPVFPILFGDSDRAELEHIAALTGGQLFDATGGQESLDGAFEEIRGYQ